MRHYQSGLFVLLLFTIGSCRKSEPEAIHPKADFGVFNYLGILQITQDAFTIGTQDALMLNNSSQYADSVVWDLGNGITKSANNFMLSYDQPGTYTVTLKAYGHGFMDTKKITVTVYQRIIKGFTIQNLYLNKFAPSQNGLPIFTKANLWLEVKYSSSKNDIFTADGDVNCPVIYKSNLLVNIDSGFHSSLYVTLNPSEKIPMYSPVNNLDFTNAGLGLIINLYGQDASGSYLLCSSRWSGIAPYLVYNPPNFSKLPTTYSFNFPVAGSPTSISLNCAYE